MNEMAGDFGLNVGHEIEGLKLTCAVHTVVKRRIICLNGVLLSPLCAERAGEIAIVTMILRVEYWKTGSLHLQTLYP